MPRRSRNPCTRSAWSSATTTRRQRPPTPSWASVRPRERRRRPPSVSRNGTFDDVTGALDASRRRPRDTTTADHDADRARDQQRYGRLAHPRGVACVTRAVGLGLALEESSEPQRLRDVVGCVVGLFARREVADAHVLGKVFDRGDRVRVEIRVAAHELRAQVVLEARAGRGTRAPGRRSGGRRRCRSWARGSRRSQARHRVGHALEHHREAPASASASASSTISRAASASCPAP